MTPLDSQAKRGRPQVPEDQKRRTVGISLSPAALARIQRLANNLGMSQGEYVEAILEANADVVIAPPSSWKVFRFQRDAASDCTLQTASHFLSSSTKAGGSSKCFRPTLMERSTSRCRTPRSSDRDSRCTKRRGRSRPIGCASTRLRSRRSAVSTSRRRIPSPERYPLPTALTVVRPRRSATLNGVAAAMDGDTSRAIPLCYCRATCIEV